MSNLAAPDVFLSYAREDRATAARLVAEIERLGWCVWWDREIPPGTVFDEAIERSLQAARAVVVLWSRHSVSSSWARTEAAEGASRGILIPVLIEPVSPPLEFRRLETIDLTNWPTGQPHPELERLTEAIALRLGPSPGRQSVVAPAVKELSEGSSRRSLFAAVLGAVVMAVAAALWMWPYANGSVAAINLLSPENGGQLISASGPVWHVTIDGRTDGSFTNGGSDIREEAVYGFKDKRRATFSAFALFVPGSGDNVKEFELLAGDDGSLFRSLGTFQTRNILIADSPYQRFDFPRTTARYVRFRLLSSYGSGYTLLTEFQLWGSLE